jgi:hypothetical protein
MDLTWVKSSHSANSGDCVEVAHLPGFVAVRDSKDPHGLILRFTADEWRQLLETITSGC